MITAQELLNNKFNEPFNEDWLINNITEAMIEFAKLHVKQALLEASNKAKIKYSYSGNTGSEYCDEFVDPESILNAYNIEENIK